jgi:predicted DNA-binding WGR domain protein
MIKEKVAKVKKKKVFSFGIKLKFDPKKEADKNFIRLVHNTDGHNKFYHLTLLEEGNSSGTYYTVVIGFGRIGTLGGTKRHGFITAEDARKFMENRLREKTRKGYVRLLARDTIV